MSNGNDIIIKGGSTEINFNHDIYKKDDSNPHKRSHATMKIRRIVITGNKDFDSGDLPEGFKGEIRISCA